MHKISVLIVLVICLVLSEFNLWGLASGQSNEPDFGKILGWVVDPQTKEPVKEVFEVTFLKTDTPDPFQNLVASSVRTDEKGCFVMEVMRVGIFYLSFRPESLQSKYSFEPYPYLNDKYKFKIVVEKDKTTKFVKEATIGGRLKFKLVDNQGAVANLEEKYGDTFSILASIKSQTGNMWMDESVIGASKEDLCDGEMLVYSIFPDIYTVTIDFRGLGYGELKKENIEVKEGETTEVAFLIDPNDQTGVEGIVFDKNKNILSDISIRFSQKDRSIKGDFSCKTDKNGFFRLIGMTPGEYSMLIMIDWNFWDSEVFEIKKDILLKKDFLVDLEKKN